MLQFLRFYSPNFSRIRYDDKLLGVQRGLCAPDQHGTLLIHGLVLQIHGHVQQLLDGQIAGRPVALAICRAPRGLWEKLSPRTCLCKADFLWFINKHLKLD